MYPVHVCEIGIVCCLHAQVSEQLQQDERQQRVVAGLKARLLQHLPPPRPPPPSQNSAPRTPPAAHAHSPANRQGTTAEQSEVDERCKQQLEREVDDFLAALMPLTAARYMAVPRAGPTGLLPQDVLASEGIDAEAWRGIMMFVPEKAGARMALRHAHEGRDAARREADVTPWWLPPALYAAAVVVLVVALWGLVHAAGGWAGYVAPQLVAEVCERAERAVGRMLAAVGAGAEGSLVAAAVWGVLGTWRMAGAVLQAWLAVRWTVALLPHDVAAGVVWVRDQLGLGLFLGR